MQNPESRGESRSLVLQSAIDLALISLVALSPFALALGIPTTVGVVEKSRYLPLFFLALFTISRLRENWQKFGNFHFSRVALLRFGLVLFFSTLFFWHNPFVTYARENANIIKPIFFSTDRDSLNRGSKTGSSDSPPCEIGDPDCSPIQFGMAYVSLPWDVQSDVPPRTKLVFEPQTTGKVSHIEYLLASHFFDRLASAVSESPEKDAFLFVHGFRNDFDDAAITTAQLGVDLKIKGAAILFSWPAQHESVFSIGRNYGEDIRASRIGTNDLSAILPMFLARSNASRFDLIAHSTGTYVAAQAIFESKPSSQNGKIISNLILAAPDIDPQLFTQIAPQVLHSTERRTVYFFQNDRALWASTVIQEGTRIGATGARQEGFDFIDAANANNDAIGHSYLFRGKVLNDVFTLIHFGTPAVDRFGIAQDSLTGVFRIQK